MAGLPGVGVVLEGEFSPERLTALSGTEFVGQGGEGPTGRGARLRALLCGDHPRVRGALVVAGAFDDVDVVAEFHRVIEV